MFPVKMLFSLLQENYIFFPHLFQGTISSKISTRAARILYRIGGKPSEAVWWKAWDHLCWKETKTRLRQWNSTIRLRQSEFHRRDIKGERNRWFHDCGMEMSRTSNWEVHVLGLRFRFWNCFYNNLYPRCLIGNLIKVWSSPIDTR